MDIEKIIERSERNIRQAIKDYGRYVMDAEVLEDISDEFICRLARDNAYAKRELRELFSKSPVWDEELDALVINGTHTHNPNPYIVEQLARDILLPVRSAGHITSSDMWNIIYFFSHPNAPEKYVKDFISTIDRIAPKAYAPNKKPSRIFKGICDTLGITDDAAGSRFQRLYALFADELSAKKIDFKLYVSLNPAHFLTMSNPKRDSRGSTLTSCHSFNSTEYQYNNGCSGYARDKYTFIAFTVANPQIPETLNNRKTTRQIFAYQPGNGLLLQSRLYNTSGGTRGAQEESKVYRDLVQREISALEDAPNLWKTYPCHHGSERSDWVEAGNGFGGYTDWTHEEFAGKVSIRADHRDDFKPLTVGTYGLCICCAEENSNGVYCDCCKIDHKKMDYCVECGNLFDIDELYPAIDNEGNERYVCQSCLDLHYGYCDQCGEYHPDECFYEIDGYRLCRGCLEANCRECDDCGEYHWNEEMRTVFDNRGHEIQVCKDCFEEHYTPCDCCGSFIHTDDAFYVCDADGNEMRVCSRCKEERFEQCECCGEYFPVDVINAGLCPQCMNDAKVGCVVGCETGVPV